MKTRLLIFNLLCFILTFFIPIVLSAQVIALSTEKLTKLSESVINGKVEKTEAQWSEDKKTIITRATIQINKVIRGNLNNNEIIVEYPGGEIGDIGLKVSDVSSLKAGEEVILFLTRKDSKDDSVFKITGNAQGHYTIDKNRIARKGGFSVMGNKETIDNIVPINILIDKIKRIK
ncbi:MAG: hypothetical protein WCU00_02230 [Candidatus Latescibacterota bacterium]